MPPQKTTGTRSARHVCPATGSGRWFRARAPSSPAGRPSGPRAIPAHCSAAARPGADLRAGTGVLRRRRRRRDLLGECTPGDDRREDEQQRADGARSETLLAWRLLFDPLVLVLALGARRERTLPGRLVAVVRGVLVGGRVGLARVLALLVIDDLRPLAAARRARKSPPGRRRPPRARLMTWSPVQPAAVVAPAAAAPQSCRPRHTRRPSPTAARSACRARRGW